MECQQAYPLDFALGTGGVGTSSWNSNGQILSTYTNTHSNITSAINSQAIDIAGYKEGLGTLATRLNVNVAETGGTADIVHSYTLEADKNFIKTETTAENKSNSTALTNVRLWVGTRDDYVAASDWNYKTKGNIGSNGFETIAAQTDQAKAIKITETNNGTGAAILFYSTSDGADTVVNNYGYFDRITDKNPKTSGIQVYQDGSYGIFLRMNDLAAGQKQSLVWYYGAGQASRIDSIINQVGQSSGAIPAAPVVVKTPEVPKTNAITAAQATASAASAGNNPVTQAAGPNPQVQLAGRNVSNAPAQGSQRTDISVGSMDVVQLSSADMNRIENRSESKSNSSSEGGADTSNAGQVNTNTDLFGPTKVFVVDGGVKLPGDAAKESDDQ